MNIEQLRGVIERNMALDPNDDFGTEKCWKEMTAIRPPILAILIACNNDFSNTCNSSLTAILSA